MTVSIRGELTETSQTLFTHPNRQLTPKLASLAALGYAIAKGDLEGVREVMRGEREWLLNEADYSGNTPLVSSPLGSDRPLIPGICAMPNGPSSRLVVSFFFGSHK